MFSIILVATEVRLTGLWVPGSSFLPFWKIRTNFTSFQPAGISRIPKTSQNYQGRLCDGISSPWTILGRIPPGPIEVWRDPAGAADPTQVQGADHLCSGHWDPLGPCFVLKVEAQNALNSSALSPSPLGGDILIQNRPIRGIPALPLATNRFEQTFPHGSFPAPLPQACSSGGVAVAKCRSQHFTCGQPDSPSGRGGQGPPQGTDKLCPWHTLAEEKHLPKQLRAVSRGHRSLKCPPPDPPHTSSPMPTEPGQKHQLRGSLGSSSSQPAPAGTALSMAGVMVPITLPTTRQLRASNPKS